MAGVNSKQADSQQLGSFDHLAQLSRASLVAASSQQRDIAKMGVVVAGLMDKVEEDLVAAAGHSALMQAYSADGTPVSLKKRAEYRMRGKRRKRGGKSTQEYMIQTTFLRFLTHLDEVKTFMRSAPPVALTKGLGSEAIFAVGKGFLRTLRQHGHKGIAINAYSFDRTGFDRLARCFRKFHDEEENQFGDSETEQWILSLTEWTVAVACSLHDLHNALKWAMYEEFQDKDLLKEVFIIYASLRNSFDEIQANICLWLLQTVKVADDDQLEPESELVEFWEALGLDDENVDYFGRVLRIWFDSESQRLVVSKRWASSPGVDMMGEVSGVMMHF